jgi:S-formylglutathione hydrolase FrmB
MIRPALASASLFVVAAALAAPPAAQAAAATPATAAPRTQDTDPVMSQKRLTQRTIELTVRTEHFASGSTPVEVVLPTSYGSHPGRRYPVTYFLAGTNNNQATFREVLSGESLTTEYESIVVSPSGDSGYWSDWFNGGEFGPPRYESFVIDTLIPLIDARFRTLPQRSKRAVVGTSMGGYGSMMIAARNPDLFVAASTLSGSVDTNLPGNAAALSASPTLQGGLPDAINGPRATEEVRWHGRNPTDLAENLRSLDVHVLTGNGVLSPGIGEGPADAASCAVEVGVYTASISLHNALDAAGIEHTYKDYGDGCHSVPNFQRQTVATFARFTQVFAQNRKSPAAFSHRSIEPSINLWDWSVHADPARPLEFLTLTAVSAKGLTLAGSGRTTVTTPPLFRGKPLVKLTGATTPSARPDARGRLRFTVDLGPVNAEQQYRPGATSVVRSASVTFALPEVAVAPPSPTSSSGAPTVAAAQLPATGLSGLASGAGAVILLAAAGAHRRRSAADSLR